MNKRRPVVPSAALDVLQITLPAILVIVGWYVVYRLQALQVRRRSLREHVTQLRTLSKEIRGAAIDFHTGLFDVEKHEVLLELLQELDDRCALLPNMARTTSCWMPNAADVNVCGLVAREVMRFRQAITLDHFDNDQQAALVVGDPQIVQVRNAARILLVQLDRVSTTALD